MPVTSLEQIILGITRRRGELSSYISFSQPTTCFSEEPGKEYKSEGAGDEMICGNDLKGCGEEILPRE